MAGYRDTATSLFACWYHLPALTNACAPLIRYPASIAFGGLRIMRHWSPWDDQLLRVLRGEYRLDAPSLSFEHGSEGGVAVFHNQAEIGLWVAASRLRYHYRPAGNGQGTDSPCDMMDVVQVSRALFSPFLGLPAPGTN